MELGLCILQQLGTSENKNLSSFIPLLAKNTSVFMWELLLGPTIKLMKWFKTFSR